MRKGLFIVFVLSFLLTFGIHAYAKFQTKDICVRATMIIEKNGSLAEIEKEAKKLQFTKSGNGITQALFTKFLTLPGLCIVTLKNGKPIEARYSKTT